MADDMQEFVTLMLKHQKRLRAFIYSLNPQSSDVDDVLQNTNTVLWEKRETFEPGTNFSAWAFKIARFQVYRQRSRDIKHGKLMFSDELIDMLTESASEDIMKDRRMSALENCLTKLSDEQRNIVDARYNRGKSLEQLGKSMNRSAGSLRIALYRIRDVLKRCVEQTAGGNA